MTVATVVLSRFSTDLNRIRAALFRNVHTHGSTARLLTDVPPSAAVRHIVSNTPHHGASKKYAEIFRIELLITLIG